MKTIEELQREIEEAEARIEEERKAIALKEKQMSTVKIVFSLVTFGFFVGSLVTFSWGHPLTGIYLIGLAVWFDLGTAGWMNN